MPGERDLDAMLRGLSPDLDDTEYVYAVVPAGSPIPPVEAVVRVEEPEGTTLVVRADDASARGIRQEFACRRITLRIHSDLEAVGLTAAISRALATEGLPANVVAGFHHDHVFVPADRADLARAVLVDLTASPTIRPASSSDEEDLWHLLRYASWADEGEEIRQAPYLQPYVEDWGRASDVGVLAVGPSGRIVGAAWARPLTDAVPELAVATVPSQRGSGLGTRLIESLVAEMSERSLPVLRLDVRTANPAIRLYERLGFERVGTTTNRVGGTSIVMERSIAP
ncbi:ACT domain-containing protein [Actinospongicola halichondriae]|uniref:ACT domain-containing protein n=1 Tax=Actinospongicola halichondriae TaxID=3236844 RepID=UPI003D538D0E